MNINFTSQISSIAYPKRIQKNVHTMETKSDSFERTSEDKINTENYPKSNTIIRTRTRQIGALNKHLSDSIEQRTLEQRKIKAEFLKLHNKLREILLETMEIADSKTGLKQIKLKLEDESISAKARDFLSDSYSKKAQYLRRLILEYQETQKKIDEFYTSGKAEFANLPDLRINLSPENIEYYENFADFCPNCAEEQ